MNCYLLVEIPNLRVSTKLTFSLIKYLNNNLNLGLDLLKIQIIF